MLVSYIVSTDAMISVGILIITLHHQQKFINIAYSHLLNAICIEYKTLYFWYIGGAVA